MAGAEPRWVCALCRPGTILPLGPAAPCFLPCRVRGCTRGFSIRRKAGKNILYLHPGPARKSTITGRQDTGSGEGRIDLERLYDRLRNAGRCVRCGERDERTEAGLACCSACSDAQRNRYRERKDAGCCVGCGKQDERTLAGRVYCRECAEAENRRRHEATHSPIGRDYTAMIGRNYREEHRAELNDRKRLEMNRLYEERRAAGVCVRCGCEDENTRAGKAACKACEAMQKQHRQWLKAGGRCVVCGAVDAFTMNGRAVCGACAETARERNRRYYWKDPEQQREAARERRRERREAGVCGSCGGPLPEGDTHVTCPVCRARTAERNRRSRARRAEERRAETWNPVNDCSTCHKAPCIEGRKLCQACYDRACANIAKARAAVDRENHPWRAGFINRPEKEAGDGGL